MPKKPSPKPTTKPKGAIIQNRQTKDAYNIGRTQAMGMPEFQKPMKKSAKADYVSSTKALAKKKVRSIDRPTVQAKRASAAGTLSVINARLTKKVSGPKSKRGN